MKKQDNAIEKGKIAIYYLHKGDNIPFYVGKTNNPNKRNISHRYNQFLNIPVILEVIDEVELSEWKYWECYWIEQFKQWDFQLENKNKGGGGLEFHSEETKNSISVSSIGKNSKNIFQFDLDGNILKKWGTKKEAEDVYGSGIGMCVIGKTLTSNGYIWSYKSSIKPNKMIKDKWASKNKKVLQFTLEHILIKEWNSTLEIQHTLNIPNSNISDCCRGKQKTCKGYIWKYKK